MSHEPAKIRKMFGVMTMRFAAAAVVLAAMPRFVAAQPPALPTSEIRTIAESAYAFAYPLVLMEFTRNGTPTNVFTHLSEFPSPTSHKVVRPNADTLYSSAWLDLSKEPILLHVPDTGGRYYLIQFMDAWTDTFAVPGKRTTGTADGWFAIVGPGWRGKLPSHMHRVDSATNQVWLLGRTQTNTAADYQSVRGIQKGMTLVPLTSHLRGTPPPAPVVVPSTTVSAPAPARVAQLSALEFFNEFHRLLAQNPPHAADGPIMKQLARLGFEPRRPFEPEKLGADGVKALEEGVRGAATRIASAGSDSSGRGWTGFGVPVGRYGVNYVNRAKVARVALGALPPEDAIYVSCTADDDGRPLSGSGRYQIHFSPDDLPPVRAFWSLTLYDSAGYFVANPIARYAIGDRDTLERNPDGSLDLWIRHDAPGGSKDRNWLPAPEGEFNLTLRLYWPKEAAVRGRWTPPAVVRRP